MEQDYKALFQSEGATLYIDLLEHTAPIRSLMGDPRLPNRIEEGLSAHCENRSESNQSDADCHQVYPMPLVQRNWQYTGGDCRSDGGPQKPNHRKAGEHKDQNRNCTVVCVPGNEQTGRSG